MRLRDIIVLSDSLAVNPDKKAVYEHLTSHKDFRRILRENPEAMGLAYALAMRVALTWKPAVSVGRIVLHFFFIFPVYCLPHEGGLFFPVQTKGPPTAATD
jgi:hypothetical protein